MQKRRPEMFAIALATAVCPLTSSATDPLNAAQLEQRVLGNTLTGTYRIGDLDIRFHEYVSKDGRSVFRDNFETDTATNEIREDGCLYTDYASSDHSDGCYYYHDNGDGTYTVTRPGSDVPGIQQIIEGDPENLASLLDEPADTTPDTPD